MKILFSPEFSGHVFIGLNKQQPEMMDTMVCDTTGLVDVLELRMGIHVEEQSGKNRTVLYYKALSDYMRKHPDNILAPSFKLSGLGTAEQALRWRDSLMMDKWNPATGTGSERLEVLAGAEEYFDCKGLADRITTILNYIYNKEEKCLFADMEILLPCEKELLHPTIIELLDALAQQGTVISQMTLATATETNLAKVAKLLASADGEEISLAEGDTSFLIYRFVDENAANEFVSLKGDILDADVLINNGNKAMDNWLRMMGKPTMGSSMAESVPQLMQLVVLGLKMMKEPLNIQSIISWLYSPMQPLGTYFGGILAETIIDEGGYRNAKCHEVVNDYIKGKYTYHDKEEDEKLTEKQRAKRDEHERQEREQRVKVYLPSFEVKDEVETVALKSYLNSLSGWASNRAHVLRESPNNEGWISQLESLSQMCDTFILLLDSSSMGQYADWKQVDSWVSTLYKGETFMQYSPQRGSRELIDSPAKMAAHSNRTVWMNFMDDTGHRLDCSFLYPSEKETIKDCLTLWNERKETDYHQKMEMLPLLMTDEQMILIVTDYAGGEPTQKHPFMVRMESQVKNLKNFIVTPNLLNENTEDVSLVRNANMQPCINFSHADLLKWPGHLSPTSLSSLVEYPLDFMMERMLKIVNTGPGSIADVKTAKGTVAHAVIEGLFAPRDGQHHSTAEEIEQRINEEFSQQVRQSIEACGAILYLPENRLEAELLTEQLRRCLDVLLSIIRENRLTVTGCEQRVTKDMGMIKTEEGWDMMGFIDMTLEDENHHPVVFDFKWTSSKSYYIDLLTANRSIQLELYRTMLSAEKRDAVEKVAYFLMPEGHLYSQEHFDGLNCTQLQPANKDNLVEQLKNAFFYRKKQIDSGRIEIGEGFPCGMLDYYNATEAESLFPLNIKDGQQKSNNFSNYRLFKGIKEGE